MCARMSMGFGADSRRRDCSITTTLTATGDVAGPVAFG
jgi:hypothetical protein